jgi:sugar transferase (PEP-CTERM/EpsH1 system associated)
MKRVLYLAHRIPYPPEKGDKIRSYQEVLALHRSCDLTIGCFVDDEADLVHIPALRELCRELVVERLPVLPARLRSIAALAGRGSLSLAYYRSGAMWRRLETVGPAFDAIVAFSSTMAPYAERTPARRKVLDLCDLDSEKWNQFAAEAPFPRSWVYAREARRLGRYEATVVRRFDATVLVTEPEAALLRARAPGARVVVVPNGVDLEFLDPEPFPKQGDGRTLVFVGAMDYFSNVDAVVWFHQRVLPRIRAEVGDIRLRIVGGRPDPAVRRLARTPGVEVTGFVKDVRPEICGADLSVAPLRLGRGVPNKVLEALALALPVVATSNAVAGLELGGFHGVDVADEAEAFARAVVRRLREIRGGDRRFPANRDLLASRYSWEVLGRALRGLVADDMRGAEDRQG